MSIQQCRGIKAGNRILDFEWINTKEANLCFVTTNGLELYAFSSSSKSMSMTKSMKYETVRFWYLPSLQFVLLMNGQFVFFGVKLSYLRTEKMNKFEIVGVDQADHDHFGSAITLIEVEQNEVGCIFVDDRKTKLYLFKVIRHQMQLTHSYHLYSAGKYSVFHIDRVLVAFNRNTEMPILIDFNGNNYISAPLPIAMTFADDKRLFSTQSDHRRRRRFRFLSPRFIVEQWTETMEHGEDCDGGHFYSLSLNLEAIAMSWGPQRQIALVHFLLRREAVDSKAMITKMLHDMIGRYCCGHRVRVDLRSRLHFISECFIVLNEVLRRAVEESAAIALHEQQRRLQHHGPPPPPSSSSLTSTHSLAANPRGHSLSSSANTESLTAQSCFCGK